MDRKFLAIAWLMRVGCREQPREAGDELPLVRESRPDALQPLERLICLRKLGPRNFVVVIGDKALGLAQLAFLFGRERSGYEGSLPALQRETQARRETLPFDGLLHSGNEWLVWEATEVGEVLLGAIEERSKRTSP